VSEASAPAQDQLIEHYHREHLEETILAALRAAGKDIDALRPEDLAPVDQFHSGGREATIELAERAAITSDMVILDVGGGLGGPARTLAEMYGCRVTVLDLSESFCKAGAALTARVGLSDLVGFQHANALELPFDDASFNLVWTQHSTMNIADKAGLYAELYRVVRPGGRYAFHEILAGPHQPIHFPVPWAEHPAISALATDSETLQHLTEAGFREVVWTDGSATALQSMEQRVAAMQTQGPPALGLHVILGPVFGQMGPNLARNLREDRVRVVQGVVERLGESGG